MISSLQRYIYSNWEKFPSLKASPKNVEFLGLSGSINGGTTTFLLFADSMKLPFGVVRAARSPFFKEDLEGEWAMLNMLKKTSLSASIPSPLFYEVFSTVPTLGESVLLGLPMQVGSRPSSHFQKALDWIVALHQETKEPLGKEVSQGEIMKIIEQCGEIFSLSNEEKRLLLEVIGVDALLPHFKHSLIVHGDFVPHNILLSGDSLSVIDWISAKRSPFGYFDMFSFSLVYAVHERKMGGLQGYINAFSAAFFSNNKFSNIVASCLREYSASLGIEVSRMRSLFALYLVMKAVQEKESIWIYFIRHLLEKKDSFIIKDSNG